MKISDSDNLAKRISHIVRYEGIHFLLWRYFVWFVSPLGELKMVSLYRKDLSKTIPKYPAKVDLEIREATDDDIEQVYRIWKELPDKITDEKTLQEFRISIIKQLKYIRLGYWRCFVGRIGEKVVHYNWIFFRVAQSASEDGRLVQLADDEAHLNIAYTRKKWRGKGIHTAVQREMLQYLRESGYRIAYTFGSTNNKPSFKTHNRLGWEPIGIILRFLPRNQKRAKTLTHRGESFSHFL